LEWCSTAEIDEEEDEHFRDYCQYYPLDYVAIDTEADRLNRENIAKKVLLEPYVPKGTGRDIMFQVGYEAGEWGSKKIRNVLEDAGMVIVIADLSDTISAGIAAFVTEMAFNSIHTVIPIVTLPSGREDHHVQVGARSFLKKIDGLGINTGLRTIVIPKDQLKRICPGISLEQLSGLISEIILRFMRALLDISLRGPNKYYICGITGPGDIRGIFNCGGISLLGFGKGKGNNRMKEAVREALKFALPDPDIADSYNGIVYITGGLRTGEDERHVSEHMQNESYVVLNKVGNDFGCSHLINYDPTMADEVEIVILLNDCRELVLRDTQNKGSGV